MKNSVFRALQAFSDAARLDRLHRSSIQSKRSAKGRAKHVGVPLKNSRVHSTSTNKLQWATWKYKAVNPHSNLITQAS